MCVVALSHVRDCLHICGIRECEVSWHMSHASSVLQCVAVCCSVLQCVAYMTHESCYMTHRTPMAQICKRHSHVNEPWHTWHTHMAPIRHTHARVPHMSMSHNTYTLELTRVAEWVKNTHEWVRSHLWTSHVTLMNETFVFSCAISHILPRAIFSTRNIAQRTNDAHQFDNPILQHTATHCNTPQHTATHAATYCYRWWTSSSMILRQSPRFLPSRP